MKTVRLPMAHRVTEGSYPILLADEVEAALKEAGVEYVVESPEQARIRELETKLRLLESKNIALLERLEQEESRAKAREKDMNYWNSRATGWESRAKKLGARLEEEKKKVAELDAKLLRLFT